VRREGSTAWSESSGFAWTVLARQEGQRIVFSIDGTRCPVSLERPRGSTALVHHFWYL